MKRRKDIFTVASTETLQILIFLSRLNQKRKVHPMTCHEDPKGE